MYKLVIVEDERDARNRLISLIDKAESKFELVGTYENGIDAYDGILSDNPDLVISDIKILYINGIELVKKIREVLPLVKVIFITGFSEFDYAKEAANLGVLGFVSKPITQEDVNSLLRKVEDVLDDEFLTAVNTAKLESFYEDNLPLIREHDLYKLSTMSRVPEEFFRRLQYNNIDLDYRYTAMCVFDFDEAADDGSEGHGMAFSTLRRLAGEAFQDLCHSELFGRDDKLCMILQSHEEFSVAELEKEMERIILRVGRFSGMPVSVGMSGVHENAADFAGMYREALRALEFRRVMGGKKVFLFANTVTLKPAKLSGEENDMEQLKYLLKFKPVEETLSHLAVMQSKLEKEEAHHSYYYMLTSILNTLIKACDDMEGLYQQYSDLGDMYRQLLESKTTEEVFQFLTELAATVRQLNDNLIVDSVEKNLNKVLAYVEAHYRDPDISFESLAHDVNFSVSYISALLKKNKNTSFVKLLTGLRMENAKELLKNPTLKIIDIAEQLGYADPYYFSHCFKKYTGLSPKEYRSHE